MSKRTAIVAPARAESLEPRVLLVGPPNVGMTIVGRVFEDLDGNGRPGRNEPSLPGVTIETSPLAPIGSNLTTDENGRFRVNTVSYFYVSVRAVPPEGMHPTPGDDGWRDAALPGDERFARVRVRPIPLTRTGGVAGSVFLDFDRDGLPGEFPDAARGWRVFLDANGDGVRQRSERMTRSNREGDWGFGGLGAGTYRVGILGRRGFTVTTPGSGFLEVVLTDGAVDSDGNLFGMVKDSRRRLG